MAAVAADSPPPARSAADLEKAAPPPPLSVGADGGGGGGGGAASSAGAGGVVAAVLSRWRRQDLLDKSGAALRGAGCVFSLLAFLVMAANEHGDWRQFDHYEEYRYVVAIGVLAFLYTAAQLVRHGIRLTGGRDPLQGRIAGIVDFAGDQVTAYLLMSALSAAIPITNRMREGADNVFTDSSSASISMAFFAFLSLALSAIVSGFKLSTQTYI